MLQHFGTLKILIILSALVHFSKSKGRKYIDSESEDEIMSTTSSPEPEEEWHMDFVPTGFLPDSVYRELAWYGILQIQPMYRSAKHKIAARWIWQNTCGRPSVIMQNTQSIDEDRGVITVETLMEESGSWSREQRLAQDVLMEIIRTGGNGITVRTVISATQKTSYIIQSGKYFICEEGEPDIQAFRTQPNVHERACTNGVTAVWLPIDPCMDAENTPLEYDSKRGWCFCLGDGERVDEIYNEQGELNCGNKTKVSYHDFLDQCAIDVNVVIQFEYFGDEPRKDILVNATICTSWDPCRVAYLYRIEEPVPTPPVPPPEPTRDPCDTTECPECLFSNYDDVTPRRPQLRVREDLIIGDAMKAPYGNHDNGDYDDYGNGDSNNDGHGGGDGGKGGDGGGGGGDGGVNGGDGGNDGGGDGDGKDGDGTGDGGGGDGGGGGGDGHGGGGDGQGGGGDGKGGGDDGIQSTEINLIDEHVLPRDIFEWEPASLDDIQFIRRKAFKVGGPRYPDSLRRPTFVARMEYNNTFLLGKLPIDGDTVNPQGDIFYGKQWDDERHKEYKLERGYPFKVAVLKAQPKYLKWVPAIGGVPPTCALNMNTQEDIENGAQDFHLCRITKPQVTPGRLFMQISQCWVATEGEFKEVDTYEVLCFNPRLPPNTDWKPLHKLHEDLQLGDVKVIEL